MNKILIVIDYFLPGIKSGGPLTTISNLCSSLSNEFEFYIITKNHDFGDKKLYKINTCIWIECKNYKIMYVPDKKFNYKFLSNVFDCFDKIYGCGLYDKGSRTLALYSLKHKRKKIFIAPMGSLLPGALNRKKTKKYLFLFLARLFKLYKNVKWSATSLEEKNSIKEFINDNKCIIAEDAIIYKEPKKIIFNANESLNVVFISRISPTKNLSYAINLLSKIHDLNINFDIYGFKEDNEYFRQCMLIKQKCTKNIKINYKGSINKEDVIDTFGKYEVFLFPTLTENFGHVIYESLCGGCIPILSNNTPWNFLKKFNCPICDLNNPDSFNNALLSISKKSKNEINKQRLDLTLLAKKMGIESKLNSGYRKIFS